MYGDSICSLKTSPFKYNILWILFGQILEYIGLLLIWTFGHTDYEGWPNRRRTSLVRIKMIQNCWNNNIACFICINIQAKLCFTFFDLKFDDDDDFISLKDQQMLRNGFEMKKVWNLKSFLWKKNCGLFFVVVVCCSCQIVEPPQPFYSNTLSICIRYWNAPAK